MIRPPMNQATANSPASIADALSVWGPLALDESMLLMHGPSFAPHVLTPWAGELTGDGWVFRTVKSESVPDAVYAVVESVRGQPVTKGTRTAIIPIVGPVSPFPAPEWMARYGVKIAALPNIIAAARAAANDPDVGRIVLAIHSPGGSVYGLPEAAAALRDVAKRKQMVASINYLGASAAYWLAATASEIVATPSALVGSIGAAVRHVSLAKAYEDFGIEITDISYPPSKRDITEAKPLSETGRAELNRITEAAYNDFKADISLTRRLDFTVNGEQYGRVVPAADALGLKLVDRVVTFDALLGEAPAVDLRTLTRETRLRLAHLKRT